jgi:hypothetical protein
MHQFLGPMFNKRVGQFDAKASQPPSHGCLTNTHPCSQA